MNINAEIIEKGHAVKYDEGEGTRLVFRANISLLDGFETKLTNICGYIKVQFPFDISKDIVAVLASLVLSPLGGCWFPLFIFPRWLQSFAKITPHAWALSGFNKLMLFGADFAAVIPEMLVLISFVVVFGIIAIYRFNTSSV